MKYLTGIIFVILVFMSTQINAIAADPAKIGVLDLQKCIQTSNEGKRIAESLKKKSDEMRGDLEKKNQELLDMQKNLEKQSLMLSDDAKKEKQKEFNDKKRDLQYLVQDMQEDMKVIETDAQNKILKTLSGVVETIAKKNNFDLIIERRTALYVSEKLDVTAEVIAELNKVKP